MSSKKLYMEDEEMEKLFKLKEHGTNIKTEIIAASIRNPSLPDNFSLSAIYRIAYHIPAPPVKSRKIAD